MVAVIDPRKCIGCYICQNACPGDLIRLHRDMKLAVLEYPDECWSCGFCVIECPTDAITISFPKRDAEKWLNERKKGEIKAVAHH